VINGTDYYIFKRIHYIKNKSKIQYGHDIPMVVAKHRQGGISIRVNFNEVSSFQLRKKTKFTVYFTKGITGFHHILYSTIQIHLECTKYIFKNIYNIIILNKNVYKTVYPKITIIRACQTAVFPELVRYIYYIITKYLKIMFFDPENIFIS